MIAATLLLSSLVLLPAPPRPGPTESADGAPVAPIESFAPGPWPVGAWDWDFGNVDVTPVTGTTPLSVHHFGTARFPAAPDHDRPWPLIVFAHGRFQSGPAIGTNHHQAGYLLDHLASWGFVVASVNLDVVGQFAFPAAIPQRGELVHATIAAFAGLDPERFVIDTRRIGLVGHSRGGEGVVSAYVNSPAGVGIDAIATIAPTNFEQYHVEGVPYLGLYGSKDGDVNNGWPIIVYERSSDAPKAFEYIEGANHFWFTESLVFGAEGEALITREQHHDIARTYITHFMRQVIGDLAPGSFAELADGPSLHPVTAAATIHPMYDDPDAWVVDNHQSNPLDPAVNTLGLATVPSPAVSFDEVPLFMPAATIYHPTAAARVAFGAADGALPFYVEELAPGTDVSRFSYVSLRALQPLTSALNAEGEPQDLRVALVDREGRVAARALGDFGTIPWPITHAGPLFPSKSVLRTTRIPLAAFKAVEPDLDLRDLRLLAIVLDQTPQGELRIDDVAFTD